MQIYVRLCKGFGKITMLWPLFGYLPIMHIYIYIYIIGCSYFDQNKYVFFFFKWLFLSFMYPFIIYYNYRSPVSNHAKRVLLEIRLESTYKKEEMDILTWIIKNHVLCTFCCNDYKNQLAANFDILWAQYQ